MNTTLEQMLQKLKYVVENRRISEKELEAGVWFEVTDDFRQGMLALISAEYERGVDDTIRKYNRGDYVPMPHEPITNGNEA